MAHWTFDVGDYFKSGTDYGIVLRAGENMTFNVMCDKSGFSMSRHETVPQNAVPLTVESSVPLEVRLALRCVAYALKIGECKV